MRDVEKTSMGHRQSDVRRESRRKRGTSIYLFCIFLLSIAALLTLCCTVFFNVDHIYVQGESNQYTVDTILEKTGLELGQNLIRLDTKAAIEQGLSSLPYIETITITRQFPNTLIVEVTPSVEAYNIRYDEGTLIVSQTGKILMDSMDPIDGLVTIYGYTPSDSPTPGQQITAEDERYDRVLEEFMEIMAENELAIPIVSIDMTSLYDIIVNFDDRIEFAMGNGTDIAYKISYAEQVISEQSADKEGYLTMIGDNECSFRNKSDVEESSKAKENASVTEEETSEELATDEYGNRIEEESETEIAE